MLLLAQLAHEVGSMVPELPPTIIESLVALQSLRSSGWLNFLSKKLECNWPVSLNVIQPSVGNI